MLKKLQEIANKMLLSDNRTIEEKKKLEIIRKILEDEQCFFKMDIDTAYNLIRELGFSHNDALTIYKELISSKNYN